MLEKKYQKIDLSTINFNDETYCLRQAHKDASLIQSIRQSGLINPPLLQKTKDGYRIVVGFKRLLALNALKIDKIDAFVFEEQDSKLDLFLLAVREHLSHSKLDPIELSLFIKKLRDNFSIERDEIIKTYLPLVGYGRNPRVFELYSRLHLLPDEWRQLIRDEQTPVDLANELIDRSEEDRAVFLILFTTLRLGKNRQREFVLLFSDVARLLKQSVQQLVDSPSIQDILAEEKLTPSQKVDRLKSWLWRQRYPRYADAQEAFESLLKKQRFPEGLFIQPPPYFEGERFSAAFQFATEEEFRDYLAALKRLLDAGDVEKIINMP